MKDFTQPYKIIYQKFCDRIGAPGTFTPSKAAFARFLGVPTGRMQHWEKGRWPNAEDCLLISDRLKININWMLNGVGEVDEDAQIINAYHREAVKLDAEIERLKVEISGLYTQNADLRVLVARNEELLNLYRPHYQKYLAAAAAKVRKQMDENPGVGIPVDPDVAEYMGAFEEDAVDADDLLDEAAVIKKNDSGVDKPKGASSKKSAR